MRIHVIQPHAGEAQRQNEALAEHGHEAVDAGEDERAEVCLVCLAPDGPAALGALEAALGNGSVKDLPLLFAGGDESSLLAAGEAYPRANFARADQVFTALASMTH